ncbi:PREDICTED: probable sodium/metabolite cotransporter BASS6, chloroplastic isoform X2 [Tarenaya hassleriana]|uniref:probable sodium/metabolite cotransporter BASS6, chloroplastic isoform X2 n=1 Tax=Tarenaya hassleriana TaxID=28532 RepID=UPI00053CA66B|nr:PREDICTED: probable sodium/metabolite cotransporter BASS6, chloroplastic isoform X2 [Tarenaya hassleriana]
MSIITPVETLILRSPRRFLPRHPPVGLPIHRAAAFPRNSFSISSSVSCSVDFLRVDPVPRDARSRFLWHIYASEKISGVGSGEEADSIEMPEKKASLVDVLKQANSILPHVVLGSTILALLYPPSFTWFTSRYFVPALGFLMFAVGINSNEKDFLEAFKRPDAIFAGYVGQYVIKPLLGYIFGIMAVSIFHLPTPIGAGIMLVSCVSGAQLSNYATFLTDPSLAPLSIVMTSLSTATAVLVTPMLSVFLIGKRLPVDVKGMISSILQVVIAPIAAGLLLNRLFPRLCNAIRPFLPVLSVLDTACCIGAPLALNINSVMSPFGATILFLVTAFHLTAFIAGYFLTGYAFSKAPDVKALQRMLSYETGMQSSLLALALATKFFQDPLVGVPPAISTVVMSLMGFTLVMLWTSRKE